MMTERPPKSALLRRGFLLFVAMVGAMAFTLLMGWPWFVYIPIFLAASCVISMVFPYEGERWYGFLWFRYLRNRTDEDEPRA